MNLELVNTFPKIITPGSFDWSEDVILSSIADDPDVFRKTASSDIRAEWGHVDPIPGHSLVHLIALSDFEKTGCNRNGDAFEEQINAKLHPTFIKYAKLYRNHKTSPKKGESPKPGGYDEGFVVKTAHNKPMGRVELLVAASHDKCADWLGEMESGNPVAFSMGFNCLYDECSICGHKAKKPAFYCEHVKKNASAPYGMGRILGDGRKCFVFNRRGWFNDISKVGTGADMTAYDLQKVASLAEDLDHVPSGAELGELYIYRTGPVNTGKRAIALKLSDMEKRIPATGCLAVEYADQTHEKVDKKTAEALTSAHSPSDMFTYLGNLDVVLPFEEFFKVAMAGEFGDLEDDVHEASRKVAAAGGLFTWAIENGHLDEACANETYNRKRATYFRVDNHKEASLVRNFSVDPAFARRREMDSVTKIAMLAQPEQKPEGDLTPKQATLAREYLAYKLSAVEGMTRPLTRELCATLVL